MENTRYPCIPPPHTCTSFSTVDILPLMWYIVTTDEPPLTYHCHRGSLMVLFILWVWINLKRVSTIIVCKIVSLAFEFSVLYLFISHYSLAPGNHQLFFFFFYYVYFMFIYLFFFSYMRSQT